MLVYQLMRDKESLLQGIRQWNKRWNDSGEGIPLAFYTEYRDILRGYKEAGETQEDVYHFFLELAGKYPELEVLIYEVLDMVSGYVGNPEFKVW